MFRNTHRPAHTSSEIDQNTISGVSPAELEDASSVAYIGGGGKVEDPKFKLYDKQRMTQSKQLHFHYFCSSRQYKHIVHIVAQT